MFIKRISESICRGTKDGRDGRRQICSVGARLGDSKFISEALTPPAFPAVRPSKMQMTGDGHLDIGRPHVHFPISLCRLHLFSTFGPSNYSILIEGGNSSGRSSFFTHRYINTTTCALAACTCGSRIIHFSRHDTCFHLASLPCVSACLGVLGAPLAATRRSSQPQPLLSSATLLRALVSSIPIPIPIHRRFGAVGPVVHDQREQRAGDGAKRGKARIAEPIDDLGVGDMRRASAVWRARVAVTAESDGCDEGSARGTGLDVILAHCGWVCASNLFGLRKAC